MGPWRHGAAALSALVLAVGAQTSAVAQADAVHAAVAQIDARYLYADGPAWARGRQALLAARPQGAEAQHALIRAALDELHDPDLHLLSPAQFAALQAETAGKRLGTGLIDFGIDRAPTGEARVVAVLDDSPAWRAGLRPKDLIVAIDGASTLGLDHEAVLDRLRGARPVTLSIRRGGRRLTMRIAASDAPFPAVICETRRVGDAVVGYIRIAQFTPDAASQVRTCLTRPHDREPSGYLLDVRDNPGGLLDEAASIAGLFRTGELGAKVRRDGSVEPIRAATPPIALGPVVVLVDAGAASAAEFLAGALQGEDGVRLVGAPTSGRGQAQTYAALDDGWGLVIPSARLRSRRGADFKDHPLQPDIVASGARSASAEDPAYGRAVAALVELSAQPRHS